MAYAEAVRKERNREATRRYRARHGDSLKPMKAASRKLWRQTKKGWLVWQLAKVRCRCKASGIECSIKPEDISFPDACPVFAVAFDFTLDGSKYPKPHAPSLDRIDNRRGYVPGNVRVISFRANILKRDASLEEIKALVKYMESACEDT